MQAHDRDSAWICALTIDQRQRWQAGLAVQRSTDIVEFTVALGETAEGWKVTVQTQTGEPPLAERVDFNAATQEVARMFRDWASRGRVQESEQLRLLGGILFSAGFLRELVHARRLRELLDRDGEVVAVNLTFEAGVNRRRSRAALGDFCLRVSPRTSGTSLRMSGSAWLVFPPNRSVPSAEAPPQRSPPRWSPCRMAARRPVSPLHLA